MAVNNRKPRSWQEKVFILLYLPAVILFYTIYKYPQWLLEKSPDWIFSEGTDIGIFYLWGKNPGFWYMSAYTALVCGICLWVLVGGKNLYQRSKKKGPLSKYQKAKFTSILLTQFIGFYLLAHVIPGLRQEGGFFKDAVGPPTKTAHVYVFHAFESPGQAIYLFIVIPIAVYFIGKRYCSWVCSCGNLAETIGVLPWGNKWVQQYTPRGEKSVKLEIIQVICLVFALFFGVMLFLDGAKIFSVAGLNEKLRAVQDFSIDFLFGCVIGVGVYPFMGTRVWCRYGCPLAAGMRLFGKATRAKFAVVPNVKCKGLGLCTLACPMGIDVAKYAHIDKKPIEISFGLTETPCIGCGGCIDACPVDALSFAPLGKDGTVAVVALQPAPTKEEVIENE